MSNLFDSFLNTGLNKDSSKDSSKVSNVEKSFKDEVRSGEDPFLAAFSSGSREEKCADNDGRVEEKIPELDTLKTFTIPKKKKAKKELLEPISLSSREFNQEIFPVICKSYKDRNSSRSFQYTKAFSVHNGDLLQNFQERRKEMRNDGYSEKDVTDCYGFLYVTSDAEVKRLCQEGAKVGNLQASCLGNPEMAVCLCRHADILRPDGMVRGTQGSLVIFKYLKGKVKSLMENRGTFQIDPTPNFDSHVSKSANVDVSQASPQQSFESTQIYLYQYEDCDIVERPRQICPLAVVCFKYVGETKTNKPLKSLPKASIINSRLMGHRPSAPPLQQMPPSPLSAMMKSPLPSPVSPASSGSMKSGPNTPQSGQHSAPSPLLPKPQSPANMQMPHLSGSSQLHRSLSSPGLKQVHSMHRSGSWSGSQQVKLPTSPAMSPLGDPSKMMSPMMQAPVSSPSPTLLQQQQQKGFSNQTSPASACSSSHYLPSPSQQQSPAGLLQRNSVPSSPAGNVQQSPCAASVTSDGNGSITVWSGSLTNKNKNICKVELLSFGRALRPCRLGSKLTMTAKVSQADLREKYFADSSHLALDQEVMLNGYYVTYCQLKPAKEDTAQFSQFISFLVKGDYAASVILEEKQLYLMSNCELTCQLGLSYETDPILHCIFISSTSRELNIQVAKGDLNQNVDQVTNEGMEEKKLEDSYKKFVPVESLIYKDPLLKAFKEQCLVQEKVNPEDMKSLSLQFSKQTFLPSVTAVDSSSILGKLMQQQTEKSKQSLLPGSGQNLQSSYGATGDLNLHSQVQHSPQQQQQQQIASSHMSMGMDMAGQPNPLSIYHRHTQGMSTTSAGLQDYPHPTSIDSMGHTFAGMSHGYYPPSSNHMMTNQASLVPSQAHSGPLLPTPLSTSLGAGRPMQDPRKRHPLLGHQHRMGGPPPSLLGHPQSGLGMSQQHGHLPSVSSAPNLPPGMGGYMTSQSFDSQMQQLPSYDSTAPGLDMAYLSHSAQIDSAGASLHPQTRDPRLAQQHQNQNLSKSLSVGATPMTSGAPLTPGITTTSSSLLNSTTTRGTKPRPTEGRIADSETTASQPSMRGLACDNASHYPTPSSSSVPVTPLLSPPVRLTSSGSTPLKDWNLPLPSPAKSTVPVYIPTPKHALTSRSAVVTQDTAETAALAVEDEESDLEFSDVSPPDSPTHYGTGLLPAAITGNPELTDDLVDVIVKGPLLKNRLVKTAKPSSDGKTLKLPEMGNDENIKHKARRTGPPLEKKTDDCQNKSTIGMENVALSPNMTPSKTGSTGGSSPSHHSLVAESIATLESDNVFCEVTTPIIPVKVPMSRGKHRKNRHLRKFYKKYCKRYLKSGVDSVPDADKKVPPVFSQSAISAGDEPDDLQVTFSWDTEPDWDTSQRLDDHDLIEDCAISVLARHMRETKPEKNWDDPESDEQVLLTDFWFHFIHYLEPRSSKGNEENVPPCEQNGPIDKEASSYGPLRGQHYNRHHPYRRSQVHYKTYFTPRDPDQLLRLLTVSNYRQKHLNRQESQGSRFSNIRFMRNSTSEKFADEIDEKYNSDDIKNLGERKQFTEELDKNIKDRHDPVTELESAWVIEKQAYTNEPDQKKDSKDKLTLRSVRKGRYSDTWQIRPLKLRRGGIFHHVFESDGDISDSEGDGRSSEEYDSDEEDSEYESDSLTSGSDNQSETMGKRRRKRWPGLRYPLDITRRFNPYLPNPTEDLPKLLEVQIIGSEDPRLMSGLPRKSIYYVLTAEERMELEMRQATHDLASSATQVATTPQSPETPMSPPPQPSGTAAREVKITIGNDPCLKLPSAPVEQEGEDLVNSWIQASLPFFGEKEGDKTDGKVKGVQEKKESGTDVIPGISDSQPSEVKSETAKETATSKDLVKVKEEIEEKPMKAVAEAGKGESKVLEEKTRTRSHKKKSKPASRQETPGIKSPVAAVLPEERFPAEVPSSPSDLLPKLNQPVADIPSSRRSPDQVIKGKRSPNQVIARKLSLDQGITKKRSLDQVITKKQSPDPIFTREQSLDQGITKKQSLDQVVTRKRSPNQVITKKQSPDKIITREQSPDQGITKEQSPDQVITKKQFPDPIITSEQSLDQGITKEQSLDQVITRKRLSSSRSPRRIDSVSIKSMELESTLTPERQSVKDLPTSEEHERPLEKDFAKSEKYKRQLVKDFAKSEKHKKRHSVKDFRKSEEHKRHSVKDFPTSEVNERHSVKDFPTSEEHERHSVKDFPTSEEHERRSVKDFPTSEEHERHSVKDFHKSEEHERHSVKDVPTSEEHERHSVKDFRKSEEHERRSASTSEEHERHSVKDFPTSEEHERHSVKDVPTSEGHERHSVKDFRKSEEHERHSVKDVPTSEEHERHSVKDFCKSDEHERHSLKDFPTSEEHERHSVKDVPTSEEQDSTAVAERLSEKSSKRHHHTNNVSRPPSPPEPPQTFPDVFEEKPIRKHYCHEEDAPVKDRSHRLPRILKVHRDNKVKCRKKGKSIATSDVIGDEYDLYKAENDTKDRSNKEIPMDSEKIMQTALLNFISEESKILTPLNIRPNINLELNTFNATERNLPRLRSINVKRLKANKRINKEVLVCSNDVFDQLDNILEETYTASARATERTTETTAKTAEVRVVEEIVDDGIIKEERVKPIPKIKEKRSVKRLKRKDASLLVPMSSFSQDRKAKGSKEVQLLLDLCKDDFISALSQLCGGEKKQPGSELGDDFKHFKGLSLETQLESTFVPDSMLAKRIYLGELKAWMTSKPLDAFMLGKVTDPKTKPGKVPYSKPTNDNVNQCIEEFTQEIYKLMNGHQNNCDEDGSIYQAPKVLTEDTVNQVYRQVNQYMNFLATPKNIGVMKRKEANKPGNVANKREIMGSGTEPRQSLSSGKTLKREEAVCSSKSEHKGKQVPKERGGSQSPSPHRRVKKSKHRTKSARAMKVPFQDRKESPVHSQEQGLEAKSGSLASLHMVPKDSECLSKADRLAKEEMAEVGSMLEKITEDSTKKQFVKEASPCSLIKSWEKEVANQEKDIQMELKRIADEITAKALAPPEVWTPETRLRNWLRQNYQNLLSETLGEWLTNEKTANANVNPHIVYWNVMMCYIEQDADAMKLLDEITPIVERMTEPVQPENGLLWSVAQAAQKRKKQLEAAQFAEQFTQTDLDVANVNETTEGAIQNDWGTWVMPKENEVDSGMTKSNSNDSIIGSVSQEKSKGNSKTKKVTGRRNVLLAALKQAKKAKDGVEVTKVFPTKKKMLQKSGSQDFGSLSPEEESKLHDLIGLVESCNSSKPLLAATSQLLSKAKGILSKLAPPASDEKESDKTEKPVSLDESSVPRKLSSETEVKSKVDASTQTDPDMDEDSESVADAGTEDVINNSLMPSLSEIAQQICSDVSASTASLGKRRSAGSCANDQADLPTFKKQRSASNASVKSKIDCTEFNDSNPNKKTEEPKPVELDDVQDLPGAQTSRPNAPVVIKFSKPKKGKVNKSREQAKAAAMQPQPEEIMLENVKIDESVSTMPILASPNVLVNNVVESKPADGDLSAIPLPPSIMNENATTVVNSEVPAPEVSHIDAVYSQVVTMPVVSVPAETAPQIMALPGENQVPVVTTSAATEFVYHPAVHPPTFEVPMPPPPPDINPPIPSEAHMVTYSQEYYQHYHPTAERIEYHSEKWVIQPQQPDLHWQQQPPGPAGAPGPPSGPPAIPPGPPGPPVPPPRPPGPQGPDFHHQWQNMGDQWQQGNQWQDHEDQWQDQGGAQGPPGPPGPSPLPHWQDHQGPPHWQDQRDHWQQQEPQRDQWQEQGDQWMQWPQWGAGRGAGRGGPRRPGPPPSGPPKQHPPSLLDLPMWDGPPLSRQIGDGGRSMKPFRGKRRPGLEIPPIGKRRILQGPSKERQDQMDMELPARDLRMFILNKDRPVCANVEQFLASLGAKSFDPWCPELVREIQEAEVVVFIHCDDLCDIHHLPNLLQLKQLPWVTFVTFKSLGEVKMKTHSPIMRRGGLLLVDDMALLAIDPNTLTEMCEFMTVQRKVAVPWSLHIHKHVFDQLDNVMEISPERLGHVKEVLQKYCSLGVIKVMQEPEWDDKPRPPANYLDCLMKLQGKFAHKFRHFMLLSDLRPDSLEAETFYQHGLGVFSVQLFMQHIVETNALPPLRIPMPDYGMKNSRIYMDAPISCSVDRLSLM